MDVEGYDSSPSVFLSASGHLMRQLDAYLPSSEDMGEIVSSLQLTHLNHLKITLFICKDPTTTH